jgi:23S rRNA (cytosine1962-C5)-methyltransferase
MKNARSYIESIAKDKKVLNLFSYTCGFSLFAKRGGAKNIINVDMSKSSLSIGMKNHSLNNLETKGISFLPYNILKSFNALKKKGPYDIIIIDPPTFQKGSFDASKDYKKIISKLSLLSSADATILACLNSPDLDDRFLITLFNENAPVFEFEKKIPNPIEYQSLNEQKSLKTLVFKRKN